VAEGQYYDTFERSTTDWLARGFPSCSQIAIDIKIGSVQRVTTVHVFGRIRGVLRIGIIRSFSKLEKVLLFFGILLISVYITNRIYSAIYSYASLESFRAHQTSPPVVIDAQSNWHGGIPDFRLWSEKRIRAYRTSLAAIVSPPLGVLEISAIQLHVPVLEGTDELTLDRAVGHIPGTAPLGEPGNTGIAGHRDGFFRGLKDVHVGETIDLYTQRGRSRYAVDEIETVSPDDVSVLAPRAKPSLTLVTCYPFYFVGSAPLRYIVHAMAADTNQLKSSEQPGMEAKSQANEQAD
jgi:sortase A